jgi:mannose-6-phosphate isomerase class I
MKDNVKNYIPELIEYKAGDAVYIDSKIVHAVSHGVDIAEKDQRITMQAFGIKCDGVWRLFF